jgi:hypothetical protein
LTSGRLDDDNWRADERLRLEEQASSADPVEEAKRESHFASIALAALDMFEGCDAEAVARLASAPIEPIEPLVQMYAQTRLTERNWDSFDIWMTFYFERRSKGANSRTLVPFLFLCREADLAQPNNPKWANWMTALLPFSYSSLADHWIEQGRYEEWADLQLLMGMSPDDLDAKDLREAAKSAPQSLLPIFHQAIDDAILARNRQGYKQAVKLMKKLEKLYKALKRTEHWSRYLQSLNDKYYRLRALQEEMAKGNIRP